MSAYELLMQSRARNPKRYACNAIAVRYGELQGRISDRASYERGEKTSKHFRPITDEEVRLLTDQLAAFVSRQVRLYGLTQADIDDYNRTGGHSMEIHIGAMLN